MKIYFYLGLGLIALFIPDVCSIRAWSRTVYYYPKIHDECIDTCNHGTCLTVERYNRKCSERLKSYTGKPCIGECSWHANWSSYSCRVGEKDWEECSLTKKRSRIQHYGATVPVAGCISSCENFMKTDYNWCRVGYDHSDWDYCSNKTGYNSYYEECWAGEYACQSNVRETVCAPKDSSWKPCGTLVDQTVTSAIYFTHTGNKLTSVELQYDARETVNGQLIDKFYVVNISNPIHGETHNREKRLVCRGTCLSQTLHDTLTNIRNNYELWHLLNLNGIRRVDPPEWVPFTEDDGRGGTIRNAINTVYVRDISPGVTRVEFVRAEIHMNHYNPSNRVNFRSADTAYMRRQPGVIAEHEAGHMVASVLGGPPNRYNLAPQHRSVNRNYRRREEAWNYENDWFSVEQLMPNFFNLDEPGYNGGYIVWRVWLHYNDTDDGQPLEYVPTQFHYLAQFYTSDGVEIDNGYWFPTGGAMNNADYQ